MLHSQADCAVVKVKTASSNGAARIATAQSDLQVSTNGTESACHT
jgi:hypothetical protein